MVARERTNAAIARESDIAYSCRGEVLLPILAGKSTFAYRFKESTIAFSCRGKYYSLRIQEEVLMPTAAGNTDVPDRQHSGHRGEVRGNSTKGTR